MCKNNSVGYLVTRIHHVLLIVIWDTIKGTVKGNPAAIVSPIIDASSMIESPRVARSAINVEAILLSQQVNRDTFRDAA